MSFLLAQKKLRSLVWKYNKHLKPHVKDGINTIRTNKGKTFAGFALATFTYGMWCDNEIRYVKPVELVEDDVDPGDHHKYTLRNRIWTEEELNNALTTSKQHRAPGSISQHVVYGFLRSAYNVFNFVTRFDKNDPSPGAMRLRLILLESIAGVPPFVTAGYRHFRSLRNMSYDGGRIYTHLEEAENERMHLISCMQVFQAGPVMKATIYIAQIFTAPIFVTMCLLSPRSLNRFVGYLEELACETYGTVLHKVNDPAKKLYVWNEKPAPPVAIDYWQLDRKATWPDVLRHIYADETMHRDINHCFADISVNARNPLIGHHVVNYERNLEKKGLADSRV